MKAWERQDDESEDWFARFVIFLGLGYSRSLTRAYKAAHPDSTSDVVSSAWRQEYKDRKWRSRATLYDMSLFHEQARETVVMAGRGMRAFARKTLKALLAKGPAMQPNTWEEAQKAFETLLKVLPPDTVQYLIRFDGDENEAVPGVHHRPEDIDADGYLTEMPEDMPETECVRRESVQEELDRVRTGEIPIFRREVYTPPEGP